MKVLLAERSVHMVLLHKTGLQPSKMQKHKTAPRSMVDEKKKKDVADKEKERLFWSNIRGVQQNRCRYCDEKWSERGRVMRL